MKVVLSNFRFSMKEISLTALVLLIAMGGCVSNKQATYLQVYDESPYTGEYFPPFDYIIHANDNIYPHLHSHQTELYV